MKTGDQLCKKACSLLTSGYFLELDVNLKLNEEQGT